MKNKALTLTVVANMTSNYGEGLGNVGSVQKVYKNGKTYAVRSRESMKNAIMVQSGLYDDIKVEVESKVNQKFVSEEVNASNNRALEGGYMNTSGETTIRKSSFYMTDAISFTQFINDARFHNNLFLAQEYAKKNDINLQKDAGKAGLMPYQYEYDKSLKCYSITIDLDRIGVDENYIDEKKTDEENNDKKQYVEASNEEKSRRVNAILTAIKTLSLVVRGNMDNAEPLFVVGGIGDRKTHYFENVINMNGNKLAINADLKSKLAEGYRVGMLLGGNFENEAEIKDELKPISVNKFFENLMKEVKDYYEGAEN